MELNIAIMFISEILNLWINPKCVLTEISWENDSRRRGMKNLKTFQWVLWINLFIGFHNIYLWNAGGNWFNILIGSLNIGVWVFNRHLLLIKEKKA